jgi:hypothetical protein
VFISQVEFVLVLGLLAALFAEHRGVDPGNVRALALEQIFDGQDLNALELAVQRAFVKAGSGVTSLIGSFA